MTFQGNPEAVPFLIASAVAAAVSVAAWRRRGHPGGLALLAMMAGETGWALFEAAELVLVDPWAKKLCFALRTSSAIVAVLGLVHFVLRYTGHTSWLKPRRCVWFWAPAVIPLVLVWTNDLHHLYWAGLPSGRFVQSYGTFLLAVPRYGPVFWIHFGYCYLLLAVVAVLLADAMSRSVGAYRVQAGVMLVGVLLPWGMNVVDMSRLFGFIHVDSVAIAFGLTGLAVLPAFYRYGLLDLAPIACAAVVRGMADPVVVLDAGGRVVALNASAEGVLGQTLAELLGQPAASFRNWPALSARLAGPDGSTFDVEGDGPAEGRSFEGRVSRLEDNGRPVGAVLVLRDVTERRLAEAAHAARVEAEADARARETFLAVLGHELRTPLTPLLAEAEVLLDDPETPPSLHPSLARIRRNAEIEARLIDDLLDLTRGRQGRLHISPTVVDAHAVIRQAVEVCEGDLRARGLTLELDLSAGAYHLRFDPARLQQVVWNLLKNAVKFSHPGGRVTVRTRGKEPPAEGHPARLVLEVADQGVGIDAALLPRVFDPFEQGDPETARRSGGLGLGLAICREIVEAHGGRISASSPGKGRGASLRVELETVAEPAHPVPALAPVEDDPGRPTLRVLLVEDNYDSREAVSRILSAQGFAIQTAGDVRTAIALADATSFDIVVSDIGLPDGSGLDLMRTLRQREGAPIAGIAISGYGTDEDVRQSLEAGFVSHLTKPLRTRDLSASILKAAETG